MACNFLNILPRDGTSQADRLLEALKDSYVQIEERSPAEWLAFAKQLAVEINFYGVQNTIEADWKDFFETSLPNFESWIARSEQQQDMPLHLALFVAFLRLLEILKGDLNALTYRHLNFYYRDILGFQTKDPAPDMVHVLFELANNANQYLLKAGTQLKAGKDASGKNLLYEVEKDTVLNRAGVKALRSVYLDKQDQSRVFMAPVADSADGLGRDQGKEGVYWSPFGERQKDLPPERRTMVAAEMGFAIASPVLLMKEGERKVTITLELKSYTLTNNNISTLTGSPIFLPSYYTTGLTKILDIEFPDESALQNALVKNLEYLKPIQGISDTQFYSHLNLIRTEIINSPLRHLPTPVTDLFRMSASGEKDWIDLGIAAPTKPSANPVTDNQIIITVIIDSGKPAIVGFNKKNLSGTYDTTFPVVRILLNNERSNFLYPELQHLKIVRTKIEVVVEGVQDLALQNDSAVLDASGTFLPFGAAPVVGSSFYIGSREVFSKQLDELKIHLEWDGLPAVNFNDYYNLYDLPPVFNNTFVANIHWLDRRGWLPGNQHIQLFDSGSNAPSPARILNLNNLVPYNDSREHDLDDFDRLDVLQKRGFIRLNLQTDFRHTEFPNLYARQAINATVNNIQLPNPPYTPKIKKISLSYKSSIVIDHSQDSFPEAFFHIEPFGSKQTSPSANVHLLPQYPYGTFYIGLENLQPPQNLSLLFQVLEGSGDPDYAIVRKDVRWSVLSGNRWLPLTSLEILEDASLGLQTSGIMSLSVWREASRSGHTVLPEGLHWLRAELEINPAGTARMIAVKAQAARAVFLDRANAPTHYSASLPAESIQKMTDSVGEVKKIQQPFVSFSGAPMEGPQDFYVRVSERLRHKRRSITLWDYERMVLEAFPEVYKVKCINHYHDDEEIVPGKVTVALIPDLRQKNAIDPLAPRASSALLSRVYDFLSQYISPFLELQVLNPLYEKIQLDFAVRFREGYDGGFYANQLNEELVRFLSPWAFEEGRDIVFGGQVYKSILLDFIEERPYVDFVTNFTLLHFRRGIGSECISSNFIIGPVVDIAQATTPRSILVSAPRHIIRVLQPGEFPCTGVLVASGVGQGIVEFSFVVA